MAIRVTGAALEEIQALYGWGAMGAWPDSQLVERFLGDADESEAAFRVLIQRHGPMVLGVCRRVLGDEHAAEDAFQATFLVFVKKARGLRDRGLLTSWLYGVALRVSSKERARGERRRAVERRAAEQAVEAEGAAEPDELRSLIDEEIRRLPEHYRLPLLLCHVEGLRHDEVARRLGCPVGTVESRLSRARERLRSRLARRGLAPSASVLAAALRMPRISGVSRSLADATVRSALESPALVAAPIASATARLSRTVRAWPPPRRAPARRLRPSWSPWGSRRPASGPSGPPSWRPGRRRRRPCPPWSPTSHRPEAPLLGHLAPSLSPSRASPSTAGSTTGPPG